MDFHLHVFDIIEATKIDNLDLVKQFIERAKREKIKININEVFIHAAAYNSLQVLEYININYNDLDYESAIKDAVIFDNYDALKYLLKFYSYIIYAYNDNALAYAESRNVVELLVSLCKYKELSKEQLQEYKRTWQHSFIYQLPEYTDLFKKYNIF